MTNMIHDRLSKTIAAALNAQLLQEAYAAQVYLSYGAWAENMGLSGVAHFLIAHSVEERTHMMKVMEYILKRGAKAIITAIAMPPENPDALNSCFQMLFEHEANNTKSISKIVKLSIEEEDWATFNFMQWFVKEQVEEETLVMNIQNSLKITGGAKVPGEELYTFDKDLGQLKA